MRERRLVRGRDVLRSLCGSFYEIVIRKVGGLYIGDEI